MSDGDIVELDRVEKDYPAFRGGRPVRALRKVSLRIPKGGRFAVRGRSGSGKTTLLSLIGALDLPTRGRVLVAGRNLSKMTAGELTGYRARTVGFVFQKFYLLPTLTAAENVELAMEALGTPKAQRKERALKLLEDVGMEDRAQHRPSRLSGGEQQRVAIARALANGPGLLLADEPTGNLDEETGDQVTELMMHLTADRGATLVVVTHDGELAKRCEYVVQIRDGVVTAKNAATGPLVSAA